MSTVGIARKRLIWKELRQQWPLVGVSVLITVLLYLLALLNNFMAHEFSLMLEILLVGLPGLFAVGIGALLVGQEKEQRTILWLQSLPIAKQELVRSKLIASLIGLATLWIVSLVLVTLFSGGKYWNAGGQLSALDSWVSFAAHPAHTLFLMLAGLAISWRVNSAFLALILLVPVAFVPYLMATLLSWLFFQSPADAIGSALLLVCQIVCCGIAGYWGWSVAVNALRPAVTGRRASLKSAQAINLGLPYPMFSALVWQFAKQNSLLLLGIISIFLMSVLLILVGTARPFSSQDYSPLSILFSVNFGLLATSWLGVLVFQSDRMNRRIRFLADRGLSPAITWTSRHAIPVCVLSIALVLILLAVARLTFAISQRWQNNESFTNEFLSQLVIPLLLLLLAIYSVSQWIGQLLTSPIVAAVAAPFASLAAVVYLQFNFQSIGTPLVVLCAVALVPLAVTRILMRKWMDDRWDLSYWLMHATAVVLFIVLPAMPLAYAWLKSPTMNAATRAALVDHLNKHSLSSFAAVELTLQLPKLREKSESPAGIGMAGSGIVEGPTASDLFGQEGDAGIGLQDTEESAAAGFAAGDMLESSETVQQPTLEELTIEQRSDHILQGLKARLDTHTGAVRVSVSVIQWLRTEMMIHRLSALTSAGLPGLPQPNFDGTNIEDSSTSDVPVAASKGSAERYQQLVNLAARVAERMRLSSEISVQEMADRLEIVIVSELLQVKGKSLLDETTWASVCKQLGDKTKRVTARRTAIAATWSRYETAKDPGNEVASLDRGRHPANLINYVTQRSRVSHVVELLWQLSESNQGNADSIRNQLATALSASPASYGLGEQGKLLRANDLGAFLFESGETIRGFSIGSQWNADWEHQAEMLAAGTEK